MLLIYCTQFIPPLFLQALLGPEATDQPWYEWASTFLSAAKALAEREITTGERDFDPSDALSASFVFAAARLRAAVFGDVGFGKRVLSCLPTINRQLLAR